MDVIALAGDIEILAIEATWENKQRNRAEVARLLGIIQDKALLQAELLRKARRK